MLLQSRQVYKTSPLHLYALTERLKLPEPTCGKQPERIIKGSKTTYNTWVEQRTVLNVFLFHIFIYKLHVVTTVFHLTPIVVLSILTWFKHIFIREYLQIQG